MATEVVQFREDEAVLAHLRRSGINPNEFARAAFEEKYRVLGVAEKVAFLKEAAARSAARRRALGDTQTFEQFWREVKAERDRR